MIGGGYFPIAGDTLFCFMEKIHPYCIGNVGWHHENIVPDILETDRNVRDVFAVMDTGRAAKENEKMEIKKKGEKNEQ